LMPPKPWAFNDWNLDYCRLRQALALMPKKADGAYAWGALKIAHLDTGYRRKKALGFASETGTGDSPWVKPSLGQDFLDNKPDPKDPLVETPWQPPGHGTRIASALCGDDPEVGFKGLAPRLPIVPYRVSQDNLITDKSAKAVGEAIVDAINRNDCKLISIGLGFPILNTGAMNEAIDYAYEKGVIVVAACGQMTNMVSYPARYRRAVGVGGAKKVQSSYQNYYVYDSYARVDIFAPADPIDRADADPEAPPYGKGNGTSYAVQHVVAAAAIWLALRGSEIKQAYGTGWRRIEAFRKLLRLTQRQLLFKAPDGCLARALDAEALAKARLPIIEDWDYEEDSATSESKTVESPRVLDTSIPSNIRRREHSAVGEAKTIERSRTIKKTTRPRAEHLRVFMCHAKRDKQQVRNLYAALVRARVDPWLDEEDLKPGQDWQHEIKKAVAASHVVLVCLSADSVTKAGYYQKEIKLALDEALKQPEGAIFVIPVRLVECEVPNSLADRYHWVDLFTANGFTKLLDSLKHRAAELNLQPPTDVSFGVS
jgi:hypothetical protein